MRILFWFVMRAILRADRTERAAQAKYEGPSFDARAACGRDPCPPHRSSKRPHPLSPGSDQRRGP